MTWIGPDIFGWLASTSPLDGVPLGVFLLIIAIAVLGSFFLARRADIRNLRRNHSERHSLDTGAGDPSSMAAGVQPAVKDNGGPDSSSPPAPDSGVGTALASMPPGYTGIRRIDSGGFADVYYARDLQNRPVAIKMLRYSPDVNRKRLFIREVDLLQDLQDTEFAPRLYDFNLKGDDPYLVMEYIDGQTLHRTVQTSGPITESDKISKLLSQTAMALYEIHERGIIHRDIKPENTIMSDAGPRIIDLGIGRQSVMGSTHTFGLGSLSYMSPEVALGEVATAASDVYGWALTMAYALTGRTLYGEGPRDEIQARARSGRTDNVFNEALDAVARRSVWHSSIVRLIRNCAAEDPASRPADGLTLAASVSAHTSMVVRQNRDAFHSATQQPTLDRMLVRRQMRGMMDLLMRQNGRHPSEDPETILVDAIRGLLRLQPTNDLLRHGVAPSVLHGVLVGPHLVNENSTIAWDSYRRPWAWEDLGKRNRIPVTTSETGLLIFD